mgnify:CR=1 FL=1
MTSRDGFHFSEKELLLTNWDYPADMSGHVRDPKVIRRADGYYMVLGARDIAGKGLVLVYRSEDLTGWQYHGRITTREAFGYMWECPDLFVLDGRLCLICCPQGVPQRGVDFANVHQCTAVMLDYDFAPGEYILEDMAKVRMVDRGFDFYAPQTFEDEGGRRILIGWMGMPDADEEYVNPTAESEGWQHCLTVPREVTYKNGMLYQYPVEELNGLRKAGVSASGSSAEIPVNGPFDLDVQVKGEQGKVSLGENLFLEYQDGDVILTLSEKAGAGRKVRKAHVPSGVIESIRVLADTTAVEIYVNGGEVVFATRYYPETQEQAVKLEAVECDGKIYVLKNYVME